MSNPYGQWVPDPLAPSGFRWQRRDEQPPTSMLPITPKPTPHPRAPGRAVRYGDVVDHQLPAEHEQEQEQDDLSAFDSDPGLDIVNTEKLGPLDEVLLQPPQDPEWRLAGETA